MKYLFIIFTCLTLGASAQTPLSFNKGVIESVDKWVAVRTKTDSAYLYGFVYMDISAGPTIHAGGSFKINKDGTFTGAKLPITQNILQRLQENSPVRFAWIPADKVKELQEPEEPFWLKGYKTDTTSTDYLFRLGFTYNAGNETDRALYYLNRVKKANPDYHGLAFEFIYAYNATKQYSKAEAAINDELKKTPKDGNLYKELVFAQVKSGKMQQAEDSYKQAITFCSADLKTEMAYNITYTYFEQKNKEKFNAWANDMQSWLPANSPPLQGLAKMRQIIGQ